MNRWSMYYFAGHRAGKTSLANIISNEMDAQIRVTSGPAIERPGDLAAILTNLSRGDVILMKFMLKSIR